MKSNMSKKVVVPKNFTSEVSKVVRKEFLLTRLQGLAGILLIAVSSFALGIVLGIMGYLVFAQMIAAIVIGIVMAVAFAYYRLERG